jgi:hypothetical protein
MVKREKKSSIRAHAINTLFEWIDLQGFAGFFTTAAPC